MIKIFYCYSKPLKNHLLKNGIKFLCKAKHHKTEKLFWMFERDYVLDEALSGWKDGLYVDNKKG